MAADISNDTRGWILCVMSSIACVFGACIVCVDIFIRMLPGMKSFNIQDSSAFLSASLSLSFGVMMFSSLFSMLPSSKKYLINDGQIEQVAGLLMIVGFGGGFIGMQIVSRIIHRFMPSHVVDCDHTHEDDAEDDNDDAASPGHSHAHGHSHGHSRHGHHHDPPESTHFRVGDKPRFVSRKYFRQGSNPATESTPLLANVDGAIDPSSPARPDAQRLLSTRSDGPVTGAHVNDGTATSHHYDDHETTIMPTLRPKRSLTSLRRPSMMEVRNRVISFVKDVKSNCDEFGPCYGYTDPCGQECKRNIALRAPAAIRSAFTHSLKHSASTPAVARDAGSGLQHPNWETSVSVVPEESSGDNSSSNNASRPDSPEASGTVRRHRVHHDPRDHEEMQEGDDAEFSASTGESSTNVSNTEGYNNASSKDLEHQHSHSHSQHGHHGHRDHSDHDHDHDHYEDGANLGAHGNGAAEEDIEAIAHSHGHASPHHHHVPANAFLSIGLQTVLAIGLHKLPEGFITFATNHANPALGFNVFLALFVHNIAEGFAMALPLYMALGSRLRAIAWAAMLGGLSQPIGAGCAAVWLKYLAHRNAGKGGDSDGHDQDPSTANGTAYGILFAITGGIMVAVALQLFVESLTIHHNRQLTIGFAFLGMMLLGLCNAIGTH
ncbi:Zinc transporter [Sporothrix bragantina]|uniref:Zinc transporter n=1 Tax=Sporothrix bragantina TaxID=671064 RepID=A0ABP0B7S2_9PEZI